MNEWHSYLQVAVEAARLAGSYQRYRFGSPIDVGMKGDKDLVTEVDRESERLIAGRLLDCFPGHNILAEEDDYRCSASAFRWIIDPLDGTTNFTHGFPWFCVSIGLEAEGELVAAAIFNPIYDELFTATKGGGAFLNGRQLKVSRHAPLSDTLLGTGFPYDCASDPANNFASFISFQKAARGIRRAGAAALDLASVASGRLDGFWELKLKPWDVAAGVLLVREAGGTVTCFDGSQYTLSSNRIVASNSQIHDEMLALLASSATEQSP